MAGSGIARRLSYHRADYESFSTGGRRDVIFLLLSVSFRGNGRFIIILPFQPSNSSWLCSSTDSFSLHRPLPLLVRCPPRSTFLTPSLRLRSGAGHTIHLFGTLGLGFLVCLAAGIHTSMFGQQGYNHSRHPPSSGICFSSCLFFTAEACDAGRPPPLPLRGGARGVQHWPNSAAAKQSVETILHSQTQSAEHFSGSEYLFAVLLSLLSPFSLYISASRRHSHAHAQGAVLLDQDACFAVANRGSLQRIQNNFKP